MGLYFIFEPQGFIFAYTIGMIGQQLHEINMLKGCKIGRNGIQFLEAAIDLTDDWDADDSVRSRLGEFFEVFQNQGVIYAGRRFSAGGV